jgi:hypothetical protein
MSNCLGFKDWDLEIASADFIRKCALDCPSYVPVLKLSCDEKFQRSNR